MNNKSIGTIGEQAVILEFTRIGVQVYTPIGDNCPVDLIADFNRKLNKIQVKTSINSDKKSYVCRLTKNFCHVNNSGRKQYTSDEVDYFAIYNLERKIPVLIPFSELQNQKSVTIRFEEKMGRNDSQIFEEKNYLFEKIANSHFSYVLPTQKGTSLNFCVDCNTPINLGSLRCVDCELKHKKENFEKKLKQTISKEELKNKIRLQSFEAIGREFNVSGNTVKKWCQKYNLPFRKEDINSFSNEEWLNI